MPPRSMTPGGTLENCSTAIGTPINYSWQTNRITSGTHIVKAIAKDKAGNTTTAQVQVTK